jgi:hypothetical protein
LLLGDAPVSRFLDVPLYNSKPQGLCQVSERLHLPANPTGSSPPTTTAEYFLDRTLEEIKLNVHEQLACQLLVNYSDLTITRILIARAVKIAGFPLPN